MTLDQLKTLVERNAINIGYHICNLLVNEKIAAFISKDIKEGINIKKNNPHIQLTTRMEEFFFLSASFAKLSNCL